MLPKDIFQPNGLIVDGQGTVSVNGETFAAAEEITLQWTAELAEKAGRQDIVAELTANPQLFLPAVRDVHCERIREK